MEELQIGMLAASKAGHDKGKIFVIVAFDGSGCYLSDGISRTVEKPKKKNLKHLQPIKVEVKKPISNETVKEAIRAYRRS